MPVPLFQPVIGSGFDADAAQQFQWANFNRAQDEANIARAQQANREYNDWMQTVAQMRNADVLRTDALAREDFQIASTREAQARRDAEARRQFDLGLKFSREMEADRRRAAKEQFEQELALTRAEETKQDRVLENFGANYADTVKNAGQRYADAQRDLGRAENELLSFGETEAKKLGSPYITYDSRARKLVPSNARIPIPEDLVPKVLAANEAIAQKVASFAGLQDAHRAAEDYWNFVQKQAYGNGFQIKGVGKDAYLYSPKLDKSFGQMVKEAYAPPPPPPPADNSKWLVNLGRAPLESLRREAPVAKFAPPSSNFPAPTMTASPGFAPPGVTTSLPPAGPITRVWRRGPNGALVEVR